MTKQELLKAVRKANVIILVGISISRGGQASVKISKKQANELIDGRTSRNSDDFKAEMIDIGNGRWGLSLVAY